jgi:hypothetical protein
MDEAEDFFPSLLAKKNGIGKQIGTGLLAATHLTRRDRMGLDKLPDFLVITITAGSAQRCLTISSNRLLKLNAAVNTGCLCPKQTIHPFGTFD